jgi:hypothetical protein
MADALATIATIERKVEYRSGGEYFVSPSLARAKVAREKKPPPAPAAPKPVAVPAIVRPSIPINGRVLAKFADYDGMWGALRGRVDEMGLTREELDHLSGNQPGYSGKLLGPRQVKKFGKHSLGNTLGATATYLVLVEDPVQTAKIIARCKKRVRALRSERNTE